MNRLPRNPYSNAHVGNSREWIPRVFDRSPRFGLRSPFRRSAEFPDTWPSKPRLCSLVCPRNSRVHPFPTTSFEGGSDREEQGFPLKGGARRIFFYQIRQGVSRNSKDPGDSSHAGALLIGPNDFRLSIGREPSIMRILATLPSTRLTSIPLFSVLGMTVLNQLIALAVATKDGYLNHDFSKSKRPSRKCSTSSSQKPLPKMLFVSVPSSRKKPWPTL